MATNILGDNFGLAECILIIKPWHQDCPDSQELSGMCHYKDRLILPPQLLFT